MKKELDRIHDQYVPVHVDKAENNNALFVRLMI